MDNVTRVQFPHHDHDDLCPISHADGIARENCTYCTLIEAARADERAKAMAEDRWISAREAREYEADIRADERSKVERVIYRNCGHTKSVGAEPCWHDVMVHAVRGES